MGGAVNLWYAETPDTCPLCHVSLHPRVVTGTFLGPPNNENSLLQVLFQCTQDDCQRSFIATYRYTEDRSYSQSHDVYKILSVAPKNPQKALFTEPICTVSPGFVQIYDQAMAAEANELDQITGIGLRKAIEFLIKDFLIHENPSNADSIKKKTLGDCIRDDITDPNVKACAARATWLGNDETHYVRKWLDKDISDLKTLIRLTVNWIENVLLTQEYLKEMDPARKSSEESNGPSEELKQVAVTSTN